MKKPKLTADEHKYLAMLNKGYAIDRAPSSLDHNTKRALDKLVQLGLARIGKNHSGDKHGCYFKAETQDGKNIIKIGLETTPRTKNDATVTRSLRKARAMLQPYLDNDADESSAVTDALTNLRHYCHARGFKWDVKVFAAEENFNAEKHGHAKPESKKD